MKICFQNKVLLCYIYIYVLLMLSCPIKKIYYTERQFIVKLSIGNELSTELLNCCMRRRKGRRKKLKRCDINSPFLEKILRSTVSFVSDN